jgi:hypothetical protein
MFDALALVGKDIVLRFIIYLYNILGFGVGCRGRPFHPSVSSSIHPYIHPRQRGGRPRALLKLQNSTVSRNCPFCPIYSRIGIHPVIKGYWPILKISGRHWGRLSMQSVRPIFFFFGFWGEGEREKLFVFFILGGGPVIHPWHRGDNHATIYLIVRR